MKKGLIVFIALLFGAVFTYAQTNYADFESYTPGFQTFGGATYQVVENPDSTAANPSNLVAVTATSGETWDGMWLSLGGTIDFTNSTVFSLKVLSDSAGTVLWKLEKDDDGNVNTELQASYTTPGQWQELSFDFTGATSDLYGKFVIFFDFGNTDSGINWYFDDLTGPDFTAGGTVDVTFNVADLMGVSDVKIDIDNSGTQVQLYDDGTNGDATASDMLWTAVVAGLDGNNILNPTNGDYVYDVYADAEIANNGDDVEFSVSSGQGTATVSFTLALDQPETGMAMQLTHQTPVVDGIIDDVWANATQFTLLKNYNNEVFDNPADLSAYWKAAWDTSGIYVLVHISSDDVHFTDESYGAAWEQDNIEVYFDMNSDALADGGGACCGNGHYQFGIKTDPAESMPDWAPNSTRGLVVNDDNSVIQELFIDWSDIPDKDGNVFAPDGSTLFGFDVYVGDNDGPDNGNARNRKVWMNDGSIVGENWGNMDEAGVLQTVKLSAYADFEDSYPEFLTFGGATFDVVENPDSSAANPSNMVASTVSAGETWDGMYYSMGGTIDFSNTSIFKLDVLSDSAGTVLWKLEKDDDGGVNTELQASYTTPGQWQELSFDFSGAESDLYGKLVLFFDFGNTDSGVNWYFDNLQGPGFTAGGTVDVTFTVTDYVGVSDVKMNMNNGSEVQMYDDGTNGDLTADDAVWTAVIDSLQGNNIMNLGAGDYTWDVIADGTIAEGGDDIAFSITSGQGSASQSFALAPEIFTEAEAAQSTIVVDGVIDDNWEAATRYDIFKTYSGETFDNPADMSAYWKATWDMDGVYVLVHITADDVHLTDGSYGAAWEQDNTEVYFNMNSDSLADGGGACCGNGHYQFGFPTEPDEAMPDWAPNSERALVLNDDNTVIEELFIAWADIPDKDGNVYAPGNEIPFGFDVYVGDNDGPDNGNPRNRKVWVNDGTGSAGTENWNSMDDAGLLTPMGMISSYDVTFNVNMNYQIQMANFSADTDSVDIAGTFNDWSGTQTSDTDGDGIYTLTISGVVPGDSLEFKARINNNWETSEFPNGGPNRLYVVVEGDNIVDFWYNDEQSAVNELNTNNLVHIYPNPNNGIFTVELNSLESSTIDILNYSGQVIYNILNVDTKSKNQFDLSNEKPGIYFIHIYNNSGSVVRKIMVK